MLRKGLFPLLMVCGLALAASASPLRVFPQGDEIMVPLAYVNDWLEAAIKETITVSTGNRSLVVTLGEQPSAVQANQSTLATGERIDGVVYVPARLLMEALGGKATQEMRTTVSVVTLSLPSLPEKLCLPVRTREIVYTALHLDAFTGSVNLAKKHIAHKDDVNSTLAEMGFTPLHIAASWGYADVAEALLNAKAEVNHLGKAGLTPLYLAASKKHSAVVNVLLARGANTELGDRRGATPLFGSALMGDAESARLLLAKGANIKATLQSGESVMHYAAMGGSPAVLALFHEKGMDVNIADPDGWRPLHFAVTFRNLDSVKWLLEHGADPNVKENDGTTPLKMATTLKLTAIETLLTKHGAK